jgi:DNA-binding LacI/PurR family transcriptional regulator
LRNNHRNTRSDTIPHKPRASVTLKDVAERVGVTASAASMALSDHSRISAKTKDAVRKAAAELGYVPSSVGRALRNQRAGSVALIVPNTSQHVFGHSYFMHVLTGISVAANARDVQVLVSTTADNGEAGEVAAYERVVRSRSADGAIVTSAAITDTGLEELVATGLPVVLIGNFPYLDSAETVGIDDVAASREITEHLIDVHGRSRLVHVTGPLDHQTGIDRRDGFLAAVTARGVEGEAVIVHGDFSEHSGRRAVDGLLADGVVFDGIVFANDDMAFGGLEGLKSHGIRVPEEVSIVGFDDFGLSRVTTPAITTMQVPAEEMARIATERLFELIEGGYEGISRQQLPVLLVERESCGSH